jgi:hypothetical protein
VNDEIEKEIPPPFDKNTYLAEIERLYILGYSNAEMSEKLGPKPLCIARNLRELKKRWARAAARQRAVLSQTQCAAVFREAMQGWFRSQQPKLTTTEQTATGDGTVKTTTRRVEGPGDKAFLMAAVAALKALRQFDPAPGAKDRDAGDEVYLAVLQLLTPEQVDNLNHVQLQRVRRAVDALEAKVEAHRRQEGERNGEPAGLRAPHQAGLLADLAPQNTGGDAGPGGGGSVPPADGLHATPSPPASAPPDTAPARCPAR